jgi:hypothetical protein
MKEDLLHYVWRLQSYNNKQLRTTDGDSIQVIQPGYLNTNAGPDFLDARIRIGATLWAGNVEMHLKASDWLQHQHDSDPAYDNVILHVVLEEDRPIHRKDGQLLPCLEMKSRITQKLKAHYQRLISNERWISCHQQHERVSPITKSLWLGRMAIERMEEKAALITHHLEKNRGDWETTFYQFLSRSLGGKVNGIPMFMLAQQLPWQLLAKHKSSLFQLEALLFGQSGLLATSHQDDYPQRLQKEYQFLSKKYQLQPLPASCWKFLRLRPANFPTIRIAQLATLFQQTSSLFSKVLAASNRTELENIFKVKLSNYWWEHYTFDKLSARKHKALGKTSVQGILINTIIPFLFLYGKRNANDTLQDKALALLESIPPEKNAIIRKWQAEGLPAQNALQTQALLQLRNSYCLPKRCLECAIGSAILSNPI